MCNIVTENGSVADVCHSLMCSTTLDLEEKPGGKRDLPDLSLEVAIPVDLKSAVSVIFTKEVSYLCTHGTHEAGSCW